MKIAEAEAAGNVGQAMAMTLRMLRLLVAEEDRARFEELIASDDFDAVDFDDIQDALEAATAGAAGRPTQRPASSPAGAPPTPPTSRVVRLSPATTPGS